jgi:putative membrane protein
VNTSVDNTRYRRRGVFGWIIVGLLAILVVGSLVFWGVALATHSLPVIVSRPFFPFGFFFFPFGFLIFLLFLFFVFRFIFWGGWWGGRRRYYYWSDAKEILRQRYARGEITKEQFDQMMRDIDERK